MTDSKPRLNVLGRGELASIAKIVLKRYALDKDFMATHTNDEFATALQELVDHGWRLLSVGYDSDGELRTVVVQHDGFARWQSPVEWWIPESE